ncbi:MAG TPA: protease pro-enzyme activation domain-containing protein [Candidatus Baltobacteraceae bacterium]|nr:protease pro-enzyme activation domain-containing protein [Candidatus Baltobacteraceae bacterium]
MGVSFRISVLSLVATIVLAACGGRQATQLLPQAANHGHPAAQRGRQAIPFVRPVDLGRRAASGRVSAVVLLRYNHQAELDRLVANLVGVPNPHYLTRGEFAGRFAPTPGQQQRAIDVLRANGFAIDKTFPNRTTLDVSATTSNFERFFATEIHDFDQGTYGPRYANVTPIRIPRELNGYVAAVTARNVVLRHPDLIVVKSPPNATPQRPDETPDTAANFVKNPGFEAGKLPPWSGTLCRTKSTSPPASIQKLHPHSGTFDAYAGTYTNQKEPQALDAVCQVVTLPHAAKVKFFTWGVSNDSKGVYQFAGIYDATTGKPIKQFYKGNVNSKKWAAHSADLSAYAGDKVYLAFGVYGVAKHKGKVIGLFVDDVTLTGVPLPATLPCPTPSTNPTPTPNYAPNDGWGPQSVENGFCMPVNYGYDGTGETAGIVIDSEVSSGDLASYLAQFKIDRTGSLNYVLIDGAAAANDTEGEATLDIETLASLAPGANIIVYVTGDLSDVHIEDAYQSALTDTHRVGVVNSSFGGCEDGGGAGGFDATSNAIAQQGAAEGMTFAASSGDQGADCYNGQPKFPFGTQGPASGPYFVAVGGTQSTVPWAAAVGDYCAYDVPGKITNPTVWNDCVGAAGGGVSRQWPLPSYQNGLTSATMRSVPDIALPAAFDGFCFNGPCDYPVSALTFSMVWGTSWSSPIYVAMQTEINQACGSPQWGIATIYNGFKAQSYHHFIDVTNGNNQWDTSSAGSTKYYAAAQGFDEVSGIGVPMGMVLATDRCNKPALSRRSR